MIEILKPYLLTFIPIFVAVDSIGNIPLFVSLVEGTTKKQKNRIIQDTIVTATLMALLFMFVGKWVFRLLGITIPDFQIAGGALLFIIAVKLLLPGGGGHSKSLSDGAGKDIGVFPLGTPLITGPAVLTTTLIMLDSYGIGPTFVSLVLNMFIMWWVLVKADWIMKIFGAAGTRAFSKIMFILLAAISIMMIRRGIFGVLGL